MIAREITTRLESRLHEQKITLLLGARRTGKTALLKTVFLKYGASALWLNGEDMDTAALLEYRSEANYRRILAGRHLLIIDEAQYIPDIARKAKLMIDTIEPLHIILTGSSAFDLVQMGDPLVGRSITLQLFPLSYREWSQQQTPLESRQMLEDRILYGNYPELSRIEHASHRIEYLGELVNTYLLRDILAFDAVKNAQKLRSLLQLIAFQIGSEVSSDELGRQLGISKNTVDRYLDLLTKVYILFPRTGFSRNLRKEVTKSKKWFFYDNGIRNAILNDFTLPALRGDRGALWEQFFMSERLKRNEYQGLPPESFFWRTYDQQEIDLVELRGQQITAFECKWKEASVKAPTAFVKSYPDASFHTVHPGNFSTWL
jgi:predicted AAA+ superfamily ATPase